MKKTTVFFGVIALAMFLGFALSGCEFTPLEEGIGTIKLTNNSINVTLRYWSAEKEKEPGSPIWEESIELSPGESITHEMESSYNIKIYIEDKGEDGVGWLSKKSYTVRKDEIVALKFPGDFSPDN
ncbi:MAG: hypothetical protein LBN21_05475 [Treponema sp.]|jgi:hypothetical protein|nr:hypothetical protein [Treponema sp.]